MTYFQGMCQPIFILIRPCLCMTMGCKAELHLEGSNSKLYTIFFRKGTIILAKSDNVKKSIEHEMKKRAQVHPRNTDFVHVMRACNHEGFMSLRSVKDTYHIPVCQYLVQMSDDMPAGKYLLVVFFLPYNALLVLGGGPRVMQASPGGNVVLPCKQPHHRRSGLLSVQVSVRRSNNSSWSPLSESRFIFNRKLLLAILKNVTFNDTGKYKCRAYYESGTPMNEEFHYDVYVRKITKEMVREGDTAKLKCTLPMFYEENGNMAYRWEKANTSLPDNFILTEDGSLTLSDVRQTDSGLYICTATTDIGGVWKERVYLKVEYLHTAIKQVATYPNNGNIVLACRAKGYPRNITFYPWIHEFHGKKLFQMGTRRGTNMNTLTLQNSPDNNGMYSCQTGNGIFNKTTSIVIYLGKDASDTTGIIAVGIGIGTVLVVIALAVILGLWLKKKHTACPHTETPTSGSVRSQWSVSSKHGYEYIHGAPCKSRMKLGSHFVRYSCSDVPPLANDPQNDLLSRQSVKAYSAPAVCDNFQQYETLQERKGNVYIGLIPEEMDTQPIYDVVKTPKTCNPTNHLTMPQTSVNRKQ